MDTEAQRVESQGMVDHQQLAEYLRAREVEEMIHIEHHLFCVGGVRLSLAKKYSHRLANARYSELDKYSIMHLHGAPSHGRSSHDLRR